MYVIPKSRGQGIGRSLIEGIAERLPSDEGKVVYVNSSNGLVDFYKACNFETITESPDYTVMGLRV